MRARSQRSVISEETTWLSVWLPVGIALSPYVVWLIDPTAYIWFVRSEFGVIENLTVIILIFAVGMSVQTYREIPAACSKCSKNVRPLIVLWALGCLYFAGEELSWGQHFFGWHTPDRWQVYNMQNETNVHNVGGIVGEVTGQLPRNLLTLFVIVAGIIVPVVIRFTNIRFDPHQNQYWLWPPLACVPTAFLAVNVTAPRKIMKQLSLELPPELMTRLGEVKECLLGLFLLLYVMAVRSRIRQVSHSSGHQPQAEQRGHT